MLDWRLSCNDNVQDLSKRYQAFRFLSTNRFLVDIRFSGLLCCLIDTQGSDQLLPFDAKQTDI